MALAAVLRHFLFSGSKVTAGHHYLKLFSLMAAGKVGWVLKRTENGRNRTDRQGKGSQLAPNFAIERKLTLCPTERRLFGGSSGDLKKNFGRNVSISDVRYAIKSPFTCDHLGLGPSSRRRCLPNFFALSKPYKSLRVWAPWGHEI